MDQPRRGQQQHLLNPANAVNSSDGAVEKWMTTSIDPSFSNPQSPDEGTFSSTSVVSYVPNVGRSSVNSRCGLDAPPSTRASSSVHGETPGPSILSNAGDQLENEPSFPLFSPKTNSFLNLLKKENESFCDDEEEFKLIAENSQSVSTNRRISEDNNVSHAESSVTSFLPSPQCSTTLTTHTNTPKPPVSREHEEPSFLRELARTKQFKDLLVTVQNFPKNRSGEPPGQEPLLPPPPPPSSSRNVVALTNSGSGDSAVSLELHPGKLTLVLDLDETLIHSHLSSETATCDDVPVYINVNGEEGIVHVALRPGVIQFLQFAERHFEIVIFTASQYGYATPVIDFLSNVSGVSLPLRLFRDHCTLAQIPVDVRNPQLGRKLVCMKDLSLLGRPLSRIIIIDDNCNSFALQRRNAIHILDFHGDQMDRELPCLIPLLADLVTRTANGEPIYGALDRFIAAAFCQNNKGVCSFNPENRSSNRTAALAQSQQQSRRQTLSTPNGGPLPQIRVNASPGNEPL